jgi:AcrR family transcriptional regulator
MATCADQPRSSSSGHAAGTERGFAGPGRTGARGFRTLVDVTHAKVAIGCHRVVRVMSAFRDTPDRPLVSARGFTVEVAEVNTSEGDETPRAGYRRSAGSPRGEARRRELLDRVTEDLAVNGLVDFSLRRAARAAGTTHKVLLYHFDGADDLLKQAIFQLRGRRIDKALATAASGAGRPTLADWVRAVWPILVGEEARVLDQAIGLAMYDPARYAELGRGASQQYLPSLLSMCPEHWSDRRRLEVAEMILATLRGFLVDARTSGDTAGIAAGFEALARALEREEAAGE